MQRIWELFEHEALDVLGPGASFTSQELAAMLGISRREASEYVRAYLDAQRGTKSRTKYVLRRKGRTKRAVWHVGTRTDDARKIVGQLGSDIQTRIERAIAPDLERIKAVNPRARVAIETSVMPLVESLVGVVEAIVGSLGAPDDDAA